MWYRRVIGGDRCPVVDTWWQTETGAIMITPLPGVTATKPGAAMTPFPGISADVVDNDGRVGRRRPAAATWCSTEPWPSMLRGIWGDPERYRETYWSRFPGRYFAGDGAKKDADGDLWLLGRVDDVMNVSGHRISTTEVESALVSHPTVAEAAVVGAADAHDRAGHRRVRHRPRARRRRREQRRRLRAGAARPRGQGDRQDRQAAADPHHPGAAEDPVGQDHAPAAAGHRREPRRSAT